MSDDNGSKPKHPLADKRSKAAHDPRHDKGPADPVGRAGRTIVGDAPGEEAAGDLGGGPVGGGPVADLRRGVGVIEAAAKTLPNGPGVYRMLDRRGDALYVGKARSLKRRVASYTQIPRLPHRLQRMVAETRALEVTTTHTEVEALLLESNYIKKLMPRFNVLLRDDKSFPHILITEDHAFPRICKHRGARARKGAYYGPFASAGAVGRTIIALQKAFLLRPCSDAVFSARSRPCLQYQIKRCSAPCVDRIPKQDYAGLVRQAHDFLDGRDHSIQQTLAAEMRQASDRLDFETAARLRDRIRALSFVQQNQDINIDGLEDADVIAGFRQGGGACIEVFFFRGGRNYGSRAYFPSHDKSAGMANIMAAFLGQFYDNKRPPPTILLSEEPSERGLLAKALAVRAGRKVALLVPRRGDKRKLIDHALGNAREALGRRQAESGSQRKLLAGLTALFDLDGSPDRIEIYDNSHIMGANAYGAMTVAGPEGFRKTAYRKFSIKGATKPGADPSDAPAGLSEDAAPYIAGDDFAMMEEMLTRRFKRQLKEDPERAGEGWPDLVLIDGGRGQLNRVRAAMANLGLEDIPLVAISKGPDRNAGREKFHLPDRRPFSLDPRDPVLYYLQRLRDEAHRFAIDAHRKGRQRQIGRSMLDEIAGIGSKRKQALLHRFGSARAVSRAGLTDLEKVDGISRTVARKVYDHFHEQ